MSPRRNSLKANSLRCRWPSRRRSRSQRPSLCGWIGSYARRTPGRTLPHTVPQRGPLPAGNGTASRAAARSAGRAARPTSCLPKRETILPSSRKADCMRPHGGRFLLVRAGEMAGRVGPRRGFRCFTWFRYGQPNHLAALVPALRAGLPHCLAMVGPVFPAGLPSSAHPEETAGVAGASVRPDRRRAVRLPCARLRARVSRSNHERFMGASFLLPFSPPAHGCQKENFQDGNDCFA